jgi:hypothetical protein
VLPDGTTSLPFIGFTGLCGTGALTGASVTNGQIASTTPFTLDYTSPNGNIGFAAVFGTPGSDVAYLTFSALGQPTTVTRPVGGLGPQFLGVVVVAPVNLTHFEIGVQGGSPFVVESLLTTTPEPSTLALTAAGQWRSRRRRRGVLRSCATDRGARMPSPDQRRAAAEPPARGPLSRRRFLALAAGAASGSAASRTARRTRSRSGSATATCSARSSPSRPACSCPRRRWGCRASSCRTAPRT